jgi:hypothetical protein
MYPVRFSVIFWAGNIQDIVLGRYLLPGMMAAKRYRDFLQTVVLMLLLVEPLVASSVARPHSHGLSLK